MADRWNPPTLRTDPAKGGNVPVTCDCGRTVSADMMVDVSTLTDAQAATWGLESLFLCDGCIARGVREGRFTRSAIAAALGAPAATLTKIRRREG